MKIGIAGANIATIRRTRPAITLARTAEAAGVESLWTYEHIVVPGRVPLDLPLQLQRPDAGRRCRARRRARLDRVPRGVTEHIAFGTGMLILPEHNPVMVAKRAATIDRLSGGGSPRRRRRLDEGGIRRPRRAVGAHGAPESTNTSRSCAACGQPSKPLHRHLRPLGPNSDASQAATGPGHPCHYRRSHRRGGSKGWENRRRLLSGGSSGASR